MSDKCLQFAKLKIASDEAKVTNRHVGKMLEHLVIYCCDKCEKYCKTDGTLNTYVLKSHSEENGGGPFRQPSYKRKPY